ncbi:DinB family protein [Marmoricola sp. RAF53]|uniref:DinB family protein n=1 Tax=Marmoricola sp. RAF53 TaxID=3233059 RepID=UPI003F9B1A80
MPIEPDTKDWTWVLERPCAECGFDPSAVDVTRLAELVHENTRGWYGALDGAGAAVRPDPGTWSRLEYACHVRDVHRLFGERVRLMLDQDDPAFANWDQDETAVESRYSEQDPAEVSVELVEAAADTAALFAGITDDQWPRRGRRSNGSVFTVATLGVYYLHDVVHHLHDIGHDIGVAEA